MKIVDIEPEGTGIGIAGNNILMYLVKKRLFGVGIASSLDWGFCRINFFFVQDRRNPGLCTSLLDDLRRL